MRTRIKYTEQTLSICIFIDRDGDEYRMESHSDELRDYLVSEEDCRAQLTLMRNWLETHGDSSSLESLPDFVKKSCRDQATDALRVAKAWVYLREEVIYACRLKSIRCDLFLTPSLRGLEGKKIIVTYDDGEQQAFVVGTTTHELPEHIICDEESAMAGIKFSQAGVASFVVPPGA